MTSPRETLLCQYHYDPLDRLISHALADTPGRQRFYCKSRLTTEIQGAMRYSIVQQDDQLLAQQRSEGNASDTTLLATDQQRSVLQTVKTNHPPQPIAYSPYGHRPVGSGLFSLLGFSGERPDPATGHYLLGNGYRAFNPVLMRFNSPDSLSPFGKGGINAYAYCGGNPTNRTDSTGHTWIDDFIREVIQTAGSNKAHINKAISKRLAGEASELSPGVFMGKAHPDNLNVEPGEILANVYHKAKQKSKRAYAETAQLRTLPTSLENLTKTNIAQTKAMKNDEVAAVIRVSLDNHEVKAFLPKRRRVAYEAHSPTISQSNSNHTSPSDSLTKIRNGQ